MQLDLQHINESTAAQFGVNGEPVDLIVTPANLLDEHYDMAEDVMWQTKGEKCEPHDAVSIEALEEAFVLGGALLTEGADVELSDAELEHIATEAGFSLEADGVSTDV